MLVPLSVSVPAVRRQSAGAADDAGVSGGAVRDGQRLGAQRHVAVGDTVECGDGGARRGARNAERAGGSRYVHLARCRNAAGAAQRQRAAVDGGGAGVSVGAAQRLGARRQAQSAGAADDAGVGGRAVRDGQRLAAQRHVAVGDAVECLDGGTRRGARNAERAGGSRHVHLARCRNAAGAAQRQRAAVDGGGAGVSVGAAQRLGARRQGQSAGAADDAGVGGGAVRDGQRLGAQRHVAVGDTVECGDGGARRGARNAERAGGGRYVHLARCRNAAGAAQRQRAAVDGGDAGVSVGAAQRLGARRQAQPAGAADDAGISGGAVRDRQRLAPSVTLLLATPLSVLMVAPAVVPAMLNVPAALAKFTWLDAAMLPVPLSASVPPLMVVAPV